METLHFMKGNAAAAEAAIREGVNGFFFYPLTPSSEIGEYMASHLETAGGKFIQAESEIAAINMMMGASALGKRVMTGTSGLGFSLMTEGISYMAGAELPAVIIDVQRAGPGLGGLDPTQADYYQVAKGCGNGGAMIPCLAPGNAQEIVSCVGEAFQIAEAWRTPVIITYEGYTGQVMEKVEFPKVERERIPKDWCFDDDPDRDPRVIHSGYGDLIGEHLKDLYAKYDKMKEPLQKWEAYQTEEAELILVASGIVGRVCKNVVQKAREEGLAVGLIRPISLSPFPVRAFAPFRQSQVKFLTVEMSYGLMVDDVRLALGCDEHTYFFRDPGCRMPKTADILGEIRRILEGGA